MKPAHLAVVVAIVTALCVAGVSAAQGGGSADNGATAAKKKKKKAKRGPPGPAGPQGLQGPKGDPGPLVGTLPSGQTLRGTYAVGTTATSATDQTFAPLSFQFPLAARPSSTIVTGGPTVACPGTVANPQATSGHFCLYVQKSINVEVSAGLLICDTVIDVCNGPSRFGAILQLTSAATGGYLSQGTWAVTG